MILATAVVRRLKTPAYCFFIGLERTYYEMGE